ncbi:MAG: hypothetical protein ACMUHX_01180 [bacterium]
MRGESLRQFRDSSIQSSLHITKRAIQEIVDMPDPQIDLFIRFCLQNNGRLTERKCASYFNFLSEDEISRMEQAIISAYGSKTGNNVCRIEGLDCC